MLLAHIFFTILLFKTNLVKSILNSVLNLQFNSPNIMLQLIQQRLSGGDRWRRRSGVLTSVQRCSCMFEAEAEIKKKG